jgi:DNA invertase Pin-like site-specific DNA recombinase
MRAAIYARVSTEAQEARGTVGSQLAILTERVAVEGHELVASFCDEGYSGARLDRPGLDALRDQAEAGIFEVVWCLSPDRLARSYPYQVLVIDELARHDVRVIFADAPAIDDDPQARLLTQVQGVIAEYERNADIGISFDMPSPRICRGGPCAFGLGLLEVGGGREEVGISTSHPRRRAGRLVVGNVRA